MRSAKSSYAIGVAVYSTASLPLPAKLKMSFLMMFRIFSTCCGLSASSEVCKSSSSTRSGRCVWYFSPRMPDVMPRVAMMQPVLGNVPSSLYSLANVNWLAVLLISVGTPLYVYLRLYDPFAIWIGMHKSG